VAERGSDHHAPRVDDALARETASLTHGAPVEARAQEWHQMEAPADGEPVPDARNRPGDTDVEDRSRLAASLRPSAFPADRAALLRVAHEEHADADVIAWIEALPPERSFDNVQAVWSALGHEVEEREHPAPPAPPASPAPPDSDARTRGTERPDVSAGGVREQRSLLARAASMGASVALTGLGLAVQAAGSGVRLARRALRR